MSGTSKYQWRSVPRDEINQSRVSERKQALAWARAMSFASLLTALSYLFFRIRYTPGAALSLLALAVELAFFCMCPALLPLSTLALTSAALRLPFYFIFTDAKGDNAPSLELLGNEAPTVDVFVLHCGEGAPLITDTLRAVCCQDYPRDRLRVTLLDDSCSDECQEAVSMLKKEFPHIHYSTRGTRPRTHARAGNMNHGLEFVKSLPGGAHEFVAFLDADNIPELCWLRRMLPHLLADPKVGAACPAARAYNIPANDSINIQKEAYLYYEMILCLLAAAKRPVVIGTGFVARASAIDELGGIPVKSLNDDGLMTIEMSAKGWKLVWVQEYLQWNLVVETLNGQIKQRSRWNVGVVDTSLYAATNKEPHWDTGRRISSMLPTVLFGPATIFFIPLSMLILPLVWASRAPLIKQDEGARALLFILGIFDVVSQCLHGLAVSSFSGRRTRSLTCIDKVWVYPYFFPALVNHWFPSKKPVKGFHGAANAAKQPPPPFTGTAVNAGSFVLLALSFAFTAYQLAANTLTLKEFLFGSGWPPLVLIGSTYFGDAWTLVKALVMPPREMDRESLLRRDPKSGLAYPTPQAQKHYATGESRGKWVWLFLFFTYCAWATAAVLVV